MSESVDARVREIIINELGVEPEKVLMMLLLLRILALIP
ncbi:MAG: hypothetical protein CM1200mP14_24510 [Gammaproteobacteria bacterium]|nr:MAG: hypothetical protein CM1200mP14_24510 [Gammaproteobacteria bacterium]